MKMGSNNAIAAVIGLCSAGASFVAPTLYVGGIKETVAVQQNQITTIQQNVNSLQTKTDSFDIRMANLQRGIDILLLKNGIDPQQVVTKK